jgi:hypothetical protein
MKYNFYPLVKILVLGGIQTQAFCTAKVVLDH